MTFAQIGMTPAEFRLWANARVAEIFDHIPMPRNIKRPPYGWWL